MSFKYVFGPVMSGRLGLSLGLDLLGRKVCSMDCVYCEVGGTETLTLERAPYVPAADILEELRSWTEAGHDTEYVTLGGSGEPTLNTEMGEIITGIREMLPGKPVAVLTNSTLLHLEEVRRDLCLADVVLPSLDTLVEREFRNLNRCAKGVSALQIAHDLVTFRQEFSGSIFLEILLIKGYNDSEENLNRLVEALTRIAPDRVDVVSLTRPGTLTNAGPVDQPTLDHWRKVLGADIPTPDHDRAEARQMTAGEAKALITPSLARRPQSVLQLAAGLGLMPEVVQQALETLEAEGRINMRPGPGGPFYAVKR